MPVPGANGSRAEDSRVPGSPDIRTTPTDGDLPAAGPVGDRPYARHEERAQKADRNWSELVQELRILGTGVRILFAFLLTIGFQARFGTATAFERDVYVVTLVLSGLSASLLVAPVALHRFLFGDRVKDEIVASTNALALIGLVVLAPSMSGAVVLAADEAAGASAAGVCGGLVAVAFAVAWFVGPLWWRHRVGGRGDERAPGVGSDLRGTDPG